MSKNYSATVHPDEPVLTILDRFEISGLNALSLIETLQAKVQAADWPEVLVVPDPDHPVQASAYDDDDEDPAPLVFQCPWCNETGIDVIDEDVAVRCNTGCPDFDTKYVGFGYDDHGDYDTQLIRAECCGRPVSLPDGWETGE